MRLDQSRVSENISWIINSNIFIVKYRMGYFHCEYFHWLSDEDNGGREQFNPFSYKRFVSDDLASRNKRVLQVFDYVVFIKLMNPHNE